MKRNTQLSGLKNKPKKAELKPSLLEYLSNQSFKSGTPEILKDCKVLNSIPIQNNPSFDSRKPSPEWKVEDQLRELVYKNKKVEEDLLGIIGAFCERVADDRKLSKVARKIVVPASVFTINYKWWNGVTSQR